MNVPMGRTLRILTPAETIVPVSVLSEALSEAGLRADLVVEGASPRAWAGLALSHPDGPEIAAIRRLVVSSESAGRGEIDRLAGQIAECKPVSSRQWLEEYLARVRVIYAFQVLIGTECGDGWSILGCVRDRLWSVGGIAQADDEGFTNEEGYHVLWQFPDSAAGPWWMGLRACDRWVHFQMDLGDVVSREAFCRGEVPDGVETVADRDQ